MRIDAHQHFWIYDPRQYPWINDDMPVLRRNFLPDDLTREQRKVQFDGSIAVQARQTLEESRWLLKLADASEHVRGVVGWVDLRSQRVEEQLAEFANHPKFVGVRHVVQDEPDDLFMLRPDFLHGLSQLERFNLTYDILIFPKQLPVAIEVVKRFPTQPFVLDHIAKPQIKTGILSPWKEQIAELAGFPNVCCKASGLVTEADWCEWKPDDFKPYLDVVSATFGEDRLMLGSDWPVCLLAASYQEAIGLTAEYFSSASETSKKRIFGENALKFYGLQD